MSEHPSRLLPLRQEIVCALVVAAVAVAAAAFAHFVREVVVRSVHWLTGYADATRGAQHGPRWLVGAGVSVALLGSIALARLAAAWRGERIGLQATAAAAAGEGPGPSVRATLVRASGTLLGSVSMASFGREAAILETGGAMGFAAGRRLWGRAPAIAAAGVAAAFASAYHAPAAAAIYVERHLRVRGRLPAGPYSIAGSAIGFLITQQLFDGRPLLPRSSGSFASLALLSLIGLPAAFAGSLLFAKLREGSALSVEARPNSSWLRLVALVVLAGAIVAVVPLSAGNGLEGLRRLAVDMSVGTAVALGLAKLLATVFTIGAGTPGGVFSPSLAIAAGWAVLAFHGVEALGVHLPDQQWGGVLVAMSMGITVSLGMPVLGAVVVAEMAGDLRLVPLCAAASFIAHRSLRLLDNKQQRELGIAEHPLRDDEG